MTKKRNKLYPIQWNNKVWHEKDVSDVFAAFYNESYQTPPIYVSDGMSIYPDGSYESENRD